ncbi:MAG: vitamin K epoxide reductase family protein [Planctomycetota bacterium]|nr:vitamin K epoxide reductase family protein [Planctomycetota bacterium]
MYSDRAVPTPSRAIVVFAALLGAASCVLLLLSSWNAAALPGCAADSDCAAAARSPWSRVPGVNFPVAGIALAYFLSVLRVATRARPDLAGGLLPARLATLAAIFYLAISFREGWWCAYCLVSHACTFAILGGVEFSPREARARSETYRVGGGTFTLALVRSGSSTGVFPVRSVVLPSSNWHQPKSSCVQPRQPGAPTLPLALRSFEAGICADRLMLPSMSWFLLGTSARTAACSKSIWPRRCDRGRG